jgi:cell division protein FtsX
MTKLKGLLLLLLVALLVDFAVENALPGPQLKLFRFELGNLSVFLLVYGSLAIGFLCGWLAHALKARKQKRAAALAAENAEAPQAAQEQ